MGEIDNDAVKGDDDFRWTAETVSLSIALFVLAGVAETVGGWLVFVTFRSSKPWYFALIGTLFLVSYGLIPVLQPMDEFGRIYAVYGGFFIIMSFLFGWLLDGNKPDIGDIVGGVVSLLGVFIIMLWPR